VDLDRVRNLPFARFRRTIWEWLKLLIRFEFVVVSPIGMLILVEKLYKAGMKVNRFEEDCFGKLMNLLDILRIIRMGDMDCPLMKSRGIKRKEMNLTLIFLIPRESVRIVHKNKFSGSE
jgi:hypothetical protein